MLRTRPARGSRRPGYTLLELLLAATIATLLMAGLYMALNMTLQQTQAARNAVESEDLSRGVFNKFAVDLSGTLAPLPPKSGGNSAGSGGGTTTTTTGSGSTGTTGGTTTTVAPSGATGTTATPSTSSASTGSTGASTTSDPSTASATDAATAVAASYSFQGGVYGTEKQLVIYTGRTPESYTRFGNPGTQVRADQRQVIYWIGPNGLYRQERPWVTADGVRDSVDPDPSAPDAILLAEEVTDVSFEYTDGSTWTTEWDGTALGPDGVSPLGPPRAIRVTLTVKIPTGRGEFLEKQMAQVIPVRSAPGTYTVPLVEAPTDGATGTTDSSTTGSGSTGGGATGGTAGSTGGSTGGATAAPASSGGSTGGGATATPASSGGARTGGTTGGGATGGSTGGTGSAGGSTGGRTGGATGGSGTGTGSTGGTRTGGGR